MTPTQITIHCSDSENGKEFPLSVMERCHLDRGFKSIGYHRVIQPDGSIHETRKDESDGAHVRGHNEGNLGICLVGRDRFTREQWQSLRLLMLSFLKQYKIEASKIFGHYQFNTAKEQKKTCPNVPINLILKWFFTEDDSVLKEYTV